MKHAIALVTGTTSGLGHAAARQLASDEATAARNEIGEELALAVDVATSKALEAKAKAADKIENDALTISQRETRIAAALRVRLIAAEAVHADAVEGLRAATHVHAAEVAHAVATEFAEVVRAHIRPVLERAAALQSAAPSAPLAIALSEIEFPNPANFRAPFISRGRVMLHGGDRSVDHSELRNAASAPNALLAEVSAYRTRAEREKAAVPRVLRGYTDRGIAANEHRAVAPKPAQVSTPEAPCPRAAQPVDASMGAHALADPELARFR